MIVHSVFCFTLLFVCVLHFLCVCPEWLSALLYTPTFEWGPRLVWVTQFFHCPPSNVYPLASALDSSPLFFNETAACSSVFSAKKIFFCRCVRYFPHGYFFCLLNDMVCRVVAWRGARGSSLGVGGPRRRPGC